MNFDEFCQNLIDWNKAKNVMFTSTDSEKTLRGAENTWLHCSQIPCLLLFILVFKNTQKIPHPFSRSRDILKNFHFSVFSQRSQRVQISIYIYHRQSRIIGEYHWNCKRDESWILSNPSRIINVRIPRITLIWTFGGFDSYFHFKNNSQYLIFKKKDC